MYFINYKSPILAFQKMFIRFLFYFVQFVFFRLGNFEGYVATSFQFYKCIYS